MVARCGGYAVRPMVWPMLLHWDGCGGTATTECPPNKGSEWKPESPDF